MKQKEKKPFNFLHDFHLLFPIKINLNFYVYVFMFYALRNHTNVQFDFVIYYYGDG